MRMPKAPAPPPAPPPTPTRDEARERAERRDRLRRRGGFASTQLVSDSMGRPDVARRQLLGE